MKIGILTFHCAHNYGAVLQTYALQEILKTMGHEVFIIDYRPKYIVDVYKIFNIRRFISKSPITSLKKTLNEILNFRNRIFRYYKFNRFIKSYINLSHERTVSNIYDAYIIGSDQVWNPDITGGVFDKVFFAEFNFSKEKKRILSYAASMEKVNLTENERNYLTSALLNFNSLGVRESSLKELLQPLTSKKIEVVLDPTLLLSAHYWNKLIHYKPKTGKKYVLVYHTRVDKFTISVAKKIAQKIDAEIIEVFATIEYKCETSLIPDASPEEFLGLIKYASYVVTTSFHGTAFSLVFGKSFYYIQLNDNKDNRVISLLDQINASDRVINKNNLFDIESISIKENSFEDKLLNLRSKSLSYLINSLKIG